MTSVAAVLECLLKTDHSIDTVQSVLDQLKISKDDLMKMINDERYGDFFQILRPSKNSSQKTTKIALTLDLFCCTHYAQQCKNQSCPFLHLCPYNIRPQHLKCTNRNCVLEHDVMGSAHNKKILDARGLSFLSKNILHEVVRASADPERSFWVCNDHPKNTCQKKNHCEKLHYCYFALIDSCTKPHCPHTINPACLAYFRKKDISEQDHDDILSGFAKGLRQRKSDYLTTHINARTLASGKPRDTSTHEKQRKTCASSASTRSTPKPSAKLNEPLTTVDRPPSEPPKVVPEEETDIFLLNIDDENEKLSTVQYLTREIQCPIKLIFNKCISSKVKKTDASSEVFYYYVPTAMPKDLMEKLRWQNLRKNTAEPLTAYYTVHEAHERCQQDPQTNQFCIFRVRILNSNVFIYGSSPPNTLQITDPSSICFDRMWIYIFDL